MSESLLRSSATFTTRKFRRFAYHRVAQHQTEKAGVPMPRYGRQVSQTISRLSCDVTGP